MHPKTLVVVCKNKDCVCVAVFEGGNDVVSLFLFPKLSPAFTALLVAAR